MISKTKRLGEILVESGAITNEQLEEEIALSRCVGPEIFQRYMTSI